MSDRLPDNEDLVERALQGDDSAFEELCKKNRPRLRKAVWFGMDKRLMRRVDASDIVQDTYLEAWERWSKYLRERTMPFYLWLRQIARDKIIDLERRHLKAGKRAITREITLPPVGASSIFAARLLSAQSTPSRKLAAAELADLLHSALLKLPDKDRELVLAHQFENLTLGEVAQIFGISEAAAQKRYTRTIERLRLFMRKAGVPQVDAKDTRKG
jgi:RNA polymerase sigma-70 factor, ECF subfamily